MFKTRVHACIAGVVGCALAVAIFGFGVLNWFERTSTGSLRAEALSCADRFATQPEAVAAWKKLNDSHQYQQREELDRWVGRTSRHSTYEGSSRYVAETCLGLLKANPPSIKAGTD